MLSEKFRGGSSRTARVHADARPVPRYARTRAESQRGRPPAAAQAWPGHTWSGEWRLRPYGYRHAVLGAVIPHTRTSYPRIHVQKAKAAASTHLASSATHACNAGSTFAMPLYLGSWLYLSIMAGGSAG